MLANDTNFDVFISRSKDTSELFTDLPFNYRSDTIWMDADLTLGFTETPMGTAHTEFSM